MVKLMWRVPGAAKWLERWMSNRVAALGQRDYLRLRGYEAEVI
jgi:hypothetical protein